MKNFFSGHGRVLGQTLQRFAATPVVTLTSIAVLGIAISLPMLLYKFSSALQEVLGDWQGSTEITLFLSPAIGTSQQSGERDNEQQAIDLAYRLLEIPTIVDVRFKSRTDALAEFEAAIGLGGVLGELPNNPLPHILTVLPDPGLSEPQLVQLAEKLAALDYVDQIDFDSRWRERLVRIVQVFNRAVIMLAILMSLGVLLIISNLVRLGILGRADEIALVDQIGGTASYVRRPFLYFGVTLASLGAVFAYAVTNLALFISNQPIASLATLYGSEFTLGYFSITIFAVALAVSASLGWLAARITVDVYLRSMRTSAHGR